MEKNLTLPTPSQLIKKAKEETIPVSLRVKERTLAVFNKIADEGNMKVGSVINSLLDTYATEYAIEYGGKTITKDVLKDYLVKNAIKLSKMSTEQLFVHLCEKGMPYPMNEEYDDNVTYVIAEYQDNPEKCDLNIIPGMRHTDKFGFDISIVGNPKNEFGYETDGLDRMHWMHISYDKWPLVATLLNDFAKKFFKQYPENDYYLTPEMAEKIVKIVDKENDPLTLAKSITKVLTEYLESMDD